MASRHDAVVLVAGDAGVDVIRQRIAELDLLPVVRSASADRGSPPSFHGTVAPIGSDIVRNADDVGVDQPACARDRRPARRWRHSSDSVGRGLERRELAIAVLVEGQIRHRALDSRARRATSSSFAVYGISSTFRRYQSKLSSPTLPWRRATSRACSRSHLPYPVEARPLPSWPRRPPPAARRLSPRAA